MEFTDAFDAYAIRSPSGDHTGQNTAPEKVRRESTPREKSRIQRSLRVPAVRAPTAARLPSGASDRSVYAPGGHEASSARPWRSSHTSLDLPSVPVR